MAESGEVGPRARQSIRLRGYDYATPGAYFITVCTQARACLFGDIVDQRMVARDHGNVVVDAWRALPSRFVGVTLDAFVLMPNHVHGIIIFEWDRARGAGPECSLSDVIRVFKSTSAIAFNRALARTGPLWQRNYYEHVIRDDEALNRVRQYIHDNPARWAFDHDNPSFDGPRDDEREPWR